MLDWIRRRFPWSRTPLAVHERVNAVGGGPLSSSIALAGFLSLFPLLLVGIAVLGFVSAGDTDFPAQVIENLGLEGEAADQMLEVIDTAEGSRRAASVIGILGLAWSSLGVVGAVGNALNATWQVTGRGISGKLVDALWLLGAGLLFLASVSLAPLFNWLPGPAVVGTVLAGVVVDTLLLVLMFQALTNANVSWRAHVPGALAGGVGIEVLKLVGGIVVPRAVASSSALYGSIGIVFAILAWMALSARLLVYASAFNVIRYEGAHGTVTVDLQVPRIEGEVPLAATRGGAVAETVASGAEETPPRPTDTTSSPS
jgi:membrane protein